MKEIAVLIKFMADSFEWWDVSRETISQARLFPKMQNLGRTGPHFGGIWG